MEATIDKETKKKQGSFYSPAILARYVASKLNDLINCNEEVLSILDPAVGDGELLMEMFNIRQNNLDTYIGVDIDVVALEKTRIRLNEVGVDCYLFNSDALKPKSIQNIDGWDYLKYRSNTDNIDCIICNPPWGAEISINHQELSSFKTAIGQYDIYDLFIEKSLDILSDKGVYAFIVPDSIFRKEHKPIRKFLLENTSIKLIARIGEFFFEDVNTPVSVIIGVKGYSPNNQVQCVH
ncbi:MAG: N-6 DNA methylase, partial [Paramuribaculum sp.]|nr:N-6 DNA methylase [Paramuribaculum sp.]